MRNGQGNKILAVLLLLAALACAQVYASYIATIHWKGDMLFDGRGYALGVDFVNSWMMGKLALEEAAPAANYQLETYYPKLQQAFGVEYSKQVWSYPPSYILAMVPFGALPYLLALGLFMVLGIASLIFTVCKILRRGAGIIFGTVFLSPASLVGMLSGQMALVFASLQWWVFHLLDRRPWLSGMLLGLLCIKPQLGIAYPVFLLATKRWRVMFAAACSSVCMVVVSGMLLGWQMWENYLHIGIATQSHYFMEAPIAALTEMMPTVFMDLRRLGVSYEHALMAQAVLAIGVALLFFTRRFRALGPQLQMSFVAAAGILMSPYLMPYDTVFFTLSLVLVLYCGQLNPWHYGVAVANYPFCALYLLAALAGLPGVSLVPLLWVGIILAAPQPKEGDRRPEIP